MNRLTTLYIDLELDNEMWSELINVLYTKDDDYDNHVNLKQCKTLQSA